MTRTVVDPATGDLLVGGERVFSDGKKSEPEWGIRLSAQSGS